MAIGRVDSPMRTEHPLGARTLCGPSALAPGWPSIHLALIARPANAEDAPRVPSSAALYAKLSGKPERQIPNRRSARPVCVQSDGLWLKSYLALGSLAKVGVRL